MGYTVDSRETGATVESIRIVERSACQFERSRRIRTRNRSRWGSGYPEAIDQHIAVRAADEEFGECLAASMEGNQRIPECLSKARR